ncbi:hypothetical protein ACN42_g8491 [Penicillium freii]|uniref:Uncharacterized protein n=1 Tax=Penicillium freii TaxID=48697 RepID=A0A101MDN2_PENFR|nr:hypothetical protein ACN42_g8491 [Penicillium freii]
MNQGRHLQTKDVVTRVPRLSILPIEESVFKGPNGKIKKPAPGLAGYKLGQKDHYIWGLCSDSPGSNIYSA